jgi:hypothetical protein
MWELSFMFFFKVNTPYILMTFGFTMFLLLRSSTPNVEIQDKEVKYEYVDEDDDSIRLEYDPQIKGFIRVYAQN